MGDIREISHQQNRTGKHGACASKHLNRHLSYQHNRIVSRSKFGPLLVDDVLLFPPAVMKLWRAHKQSPAVKAEPGIDWRLLTPRSSCYLWSHCRNNSAGGNCRGRPPSWCFATPDTIKSFVVKFRTLLRHSGGSSGFHTWTVFRAIYRFHGGGLESVTAWTSALKVLLWFRSPPPGDQGQKQTVSWIFASFVSNP